MHAPSPLSTDEPIPKPPRRASLAIGFCLAAQLLVISRVLCLPRALCGHPAARSGCSPSFWPFLDYPMFSEAHYPGETIPRRYLILRHATRRERAFYPERRGRLDTGAVLAADARGERDTAERLVQSALGPGPWSLRVEQFTLELTASGFAPKCVETVDADHLPTLSGEQGVER